MCCTVNTHVCCSCAAGKAWWDQFLQSSYHKMSSQTPQVRLGGCGVELAAGPSTHKQKLLPGTSTHKQLQQPSARVRAALSISARRLTPFCANSRLTVTHTFCRAVSRCALLLPVLPIAHRA